MKSATCRETIVALTVAATVGHVAFAQSLKLTANELREKGLQEYQAGRYDSALRTWVATEESARTEGQRELAARAVCLQSRAQEAMGRSAAGVELARRCLNELVLLGLPHWDALQQLVDSMTTARGVSEVENVLERHIREIQRGPTHSDCDITLLIYQLGSLHQIAGRYREAEKWYREGVGILESRSQVLDAAQLARFLDALSVVYERLGEVRRAADACERSQELHLTREGKTMAVAGAFEECSRLLTRAGRRKEAAESMERAASIRASIDGPPDFISVE